MEKTNNGENSAEVTDDKLEECKTLEAESDVIDKTKTFEELGVCPILCNTCQELSYSHPTKIQRESIPYALQGKDIIGLAETGSGKTAAFCLPLLQNLLDNPTPFYGCILAPTRELSLQINNHISALGAKIQLRTAVLVGGFDMIQQAIALSKKPHVVIATPGRLADHLTNTKGFSLKNLKYLVFDEADKLLNLDFEKQIDQILSVLPRARTTLLYSATMTSKVKRLQRASLQNPIKLEINSKNKTVSSLSQHYLFIPAKHKDCYLTHILTKHSSSSTIVFISTIISSLKLLYTLQTLNIKACILNSKLPQSKRLENLHAFTTGKIKILLATDVANRGLDIKGVDLVINYDLPENCKDYVHRVGRTARVGNVGVSVSFVTQYDVETFQKIEHFLGEKIALFQGVVESEALLLYDSVIEASRIAAGTMREKEKKSGREWFKKGEGVDDSEEIGERGERIGGKRKKRSRNAFDTGSFVRRKKILNQVQKFKKK